MYLVCEAARNNLCIFLGCRCESLQATNSGDERFKVVLSHSGCLYPEGGGQPGDRGRLCAADGKLLVHTSLHAYKMSSGYVCDASFSRYQSIYVYISGVLLMSPASKEGGAEHHKMSFAHMRAYYEHQCSVVRAVTKKAGLLGLCGPFSPLAFLDATG